MSSNRTAGVAGSKLGAGLAGAGVEQTDAPVPNKPVRTTRFDRVPGKRKMREFPLTKQEILALGAVQGGAALFFGLSGALFGFFINVKQAIAFAATDTPADKLAYWDGLKDASFWGGVALAVIGAVMFGISGWAALRIILETEHAR